MAERRSGARHLTGLSARLLVLTAFFIMLSEFLIYAPSIARYRKVYLEDHVATAQLASLALEAAPDRMVGPELERELLRYAGAYMVVLRQAGRKILALGEDMPVSADVTFDLRDETFMGWIPDAFDALLQRRNRIMRVIGVSPHNPSVALEVVLDETPMREAMYGYSSRILQLSIVISLIAGGLVYLSLQWLMVRPMRRITENMTAFRESPEDDSRTIGPSRRSDEIGVVQRELAHMQSEIRTALRQKTRLATLGAAVAKVNHDLRNSLATAVLISDRLASIEDPEVKEVTPRLIEAIDRAVELCSQTLSYAQDSAPPLQRSCFALGELVAEVEGAVRSALEGVASVKWGNDVPADITVDADRSELFRVLSNLGRNSIQAGAGTMRFTAGLDGERVWIDVADDGPGLSAQARQRLFQAFAGSTREGGTGLGLVIARDIMRAHGGDIALLSSGEDGTVFRLHLPIRRSSS